MNNVISFYWWLLGGRYKQSSQEHCPKQHFYCRNKSYKNLKFKEVMLQNIGFTITCLCTVEPTVNDRCRYQNEIL